MKKNLTPQQRWDRKNKKTVRESKAEYDKKNPVWAFRPYEELRKWLLSAKTNDENGKLETNAAVTIRKLEKLKKLEEEQKAP